MPQTEIWLKTGNQTARFENEQKNSTIFALAKGVEQLSNLENISWRRVSRLGKSP